MIIRAVDNQLFQKFIQHKMSLLKNHCNSSYNNINGNVHKGQNLTFE